MILEILALGACVIGGFIAGKVKKVEAPKVLTWEDLLESFVEEIEQGVEGYRFEMPNTLIAPNGLRYTINSDCRLRNLLIKALHNQHKYKQLRIE